MFLRVTSLAGIASLSVLAACTMGEPVSQTGPTVAATGFGANLPAALTPGKGCGGTGGVKVTPCPLRLTSQTRHVVVTVSGPGVVNSYLDGLNFCVKHQLCYLAERVGSSQTKWRISSGPACGNADIQFSGVNASAQEVGDAFLMVTNKYCP